MPPGAINFTNVTLLQCQDLASPLHKLDKTVIVRVSRLLELRKYFAYIYLAGTRLCASSAACAPELPYSIKEEVELFIKAISHTLRQKLSGICASRDPCKRHKKAGIPHL